MTNCEDCAQAQFCHRFCEQQLGTSAEVYEGIGVSTDTKHCVCKVGVPLPAQPKPEAPDPKAQAPK